MASLAVHHKLLILGGTVEARQQADVLANLGYSLIYSLAGVTQKPILPQHEGIEIHRGGFGGLQGLEDFIIANSVDCLIDATHPFAEKISDTCRKITSVPVVRLGRNIWEPKAGDLWTHVADMEGAIHTLPLYINGSVFLALGAKHLSAFKDVKHLSFVARMIEVPDNSSRSNLQILQQRGPFTVADEMSLFRDRSVRLLVTRNSGAEASYPKIEAARQLKIPVLMIDRPKPVVAQNSVTTIKAAQLVSHLSLLLR